MDSLLPPGSRRNLEARVQAAEHLGRTAVASVDRALARGSWLGVRTTAWIGELARSSGVTQKASAGQTPSATEPFHGWRRV
jgi:hypothetical protein